MTDTFEYHAEVPRDLLRNLDYRDRLLEISLESDRCRQGIMEMCRVDPLYWINAFVWQFNPNAIGGQLERGPFTTYPFQDDAVREVNAAIDEKRQISIQKSRELGLSWIVLMVFTHRFLFKENQKFLCLSRDQDAVDKTGEADSLFWKIEFMLEHLPLWMMPKGWDIRKHRLKNRFIHPSSNSSMTGAASTSKVGVGGRARGILLDEFPQMNNGSEIRRRTANTSRCRIFVGTHLGLGTEFFKITQQSDIRGLTYHWYQHPEKKRGAYRYDKVNNKVVHLDPTYPYDPDYPYVKDGTPTGGPFPGIRSQWYDDMCSRIGHQRDVCMDLDIDPQGSSKNVFDHVMIQGLLESTTRPPVWQGDAKVDRATGRIQELFESLGGPLLLWCHRNDGRPKASSYGAGADISRGQGATPSVLSIGDSRTGEKVLEYAYARIKPEEFAELAHALCQLFADENGAGAAIAWDMSGPGAEFAQRLYHDLGYRNVYYRKDEVSPLKVHSKEPGWYSDDESKNMMLSQYAVALREMHFINRSKLALEEMFAYEWSTDRKIYHFGAINKDDPSQAGQNHGDRPIADGLCWKMMKKLGAGKRYQPVTSELPTGHPVFSFGWRMEQRAKAQRDVAWV